ncbi:MAG: hypothetical protein ACREO3_03680 [Arenimonas sp.]
MTYSSWVLAAYGYLLAVLPWVVAGERFLFPQVLALSGVGGACLVYACTNDYEVMLRNSDWSLGRSGKIATALTLLALIATVYLLLQGQAEKGRGLANFHGRFAALPGLEFFLFGRSIAKR